MRSRIKRALSGLESKRYVGRVVRIAAATWRGPENSGRVLNLQGRVDGLERLHIDQLSRLFEIVTEVHSRQLTNDFETANLVASVPLTLRSLTRGSVAVRSDLETTSRLVASLSEALESLNARADEVAARVDAVGENSTESLRASIARDLERVAAVEARAEEHAQTLTYLLERLEFVRSELMFEVRYGKAAAVPSTESIEPIVRVDFTALADLRVNLGSGHIPLDGYVNVDNRDLPGVDVVADVERLPFADGSVAEFFSSHFLEHFPEEQLRRRVLPSLGRKLRPGGTFRAVVPDVDAMMAKYLGGELPFSDLREVVYGGQDYDGDFHYTMFTASSIGDLLSGAGLEDVAVIVEARPNGKSLELEVSARKPLA